MTSNLTVIFIPKCDIINRQNMLIQPLYLSNSPKNQFTFRVKHDQPPITIRSNFDSGNISKVQLGINNCIMVSPANDCSGSEYQSHAKGWFYFGVSGFQAGTRQKFIVKRMNQLGGNIKFSDYFKPVYKYGIDGNWERLQQATTFNKQDDTQLHFQFQFQKSAEVFIAYSYPFSYSDCQKMLTNIKNQAKQIKNLYYQDQIIISSVQGRPIHLLTISSNDHKLSSKQSPIDQNLFMASMNNSRAYKFMDVKKVVIISARVHPGQAPSSHVMNGILNFLVSKDARAELLRKNFVFKIIPMLNPDGVFHGHYRMDTLNQNLNRFYLEPDPLRHPSSYALKKLGQYFKLQNRLCFFMDLHAHPQKKGNFIYGNSIQNQTQQIQTQLYPKLLSLNCVEFDYQNSCFSKNHMTHKDRNEDYSKQGCSRVVFHREIGAIYSYTMQCGYTASNYLNQLAPLTNPHRKVEKLGIVHSDLDNVKSLYYATNDKEKKKYLTIRSHENLGRCVLISLLDLFELNIFSRLPNGNLKTLPQIRQSISQYLVKSSKQYKAYTQKFALQSNSQSNPQSNHTPLTLLKKSDRQKNNQTCTIGRSLPKAIIGFFDRKIISSKMLSNSNNNNNQKDKQQRDIIRRRTLPKMKMYK